MKYNLNSRLYLYHKTISKYDFIEKYINFLQSNTILRHFKINCNIYQEFHNNLNELFHKELLTYKKVHLKIKNTSHFKQGFTQVVVSIRKKYLFFYLELLLNSVFLTKKPTFLFHKKIVTCVFKSRLDSSSSFFRTHLIFASKVNRISLNFKFSYQLWNRFQLPKDYLFLSKF